MIPLESIASLNRWLPKLEQYSALLNKEADVILLKPIELQSEDSSLQTIEAEKANGPSRDPLLVTESQAPQQQVDELSPPVLLPFPTTVATPQHDATEICSVAIVHLPVDGILKQIKKSNPFVLGLVTAGTVQDTSFGDSNSVTQQIVSQLADRLHEKTDRATLVIRVQPSPLDAEHFEKKSPTSHSQHFTTDWLDFDDTRAGRQKWYSQVSDLTLWKQEFGLVVLDLGNAGSPSVGKIGRLCDGVVVQVLGITQSKSTFGQLKSLNKHRLKLLGVWSMESAATSEAA